MNYVAGLAFHKDDFNQVALIQKERPDWQKGFLNGIGGKIEQKELPIQAMIREFEEETGYTSSQEDWKPFLKLIGNNWIVTWFKSFSIDLNELKTTTDKEIIIMRTSALKLKSTKVIDNLKWILPMALDEKMHYSTATYG